MLIVWIFVATIVSRVRIFVATIVMLLACIIGITRIRTYNEKVLFYKTNKDVRTEVYC